MYVHEVKPLLMHVRVHVCMWLKSHLTHCIATWTME